MLCFQGLNELMKGIHCFHSYWSILASCGVKQVFTASGSLNLGVGVSVSRCRTHLFTGLYLWTLAWAILGHKKVYFPNTITLER